MTATTHRHSLRLRRTRGADSQRSSPAASTPASRTAALRSTALGLDARRHAATAAIDAVAAALATHRSAAPAAVSEYDQDHPHGHWTAAQPAGVALRLARERAGLAAASVAEAEDMASVANVLWSLPQAERSHNGCTHAPLPPAPAANGRLLQLATTAILAGVIDMSAVFEAAAALAHSKTQDRDRAQSSMSSSFRSLALSTAALRHHTRSTSSAADAMHALD